MPSKPLRLCAHPMCPNLIPVGTSYCREHQRDVHKEYKARRTDIDEQKFYNSTAWRKVREQHLKIEPLCRMCKGQGQTKLADMVDHITPIKQGGAKLSHSNLQSLCNACHNKKTKEEQRNG